ncbi:hypothetical protein RPHASCH2410_CH18055 [Rhizobium phaseoli Ch24-10]|nr:hypothetical protein RPHASCH2410_CH18055 [Rhizobium phaseoli Ch24-10]
MRRRRLRRFASNFCMRCVCPLLVHAVSRCRRRVPGDMHQRMDAAGNGACKVKNLRKTPPFLALRLEELI